MNKGLKIGINVILIAVVAYLGFNLYENIMRPIKFKAEYEKRADIVKNKMLTIREIELAYLDRYNRYCSDFDTLINFIETDSLIVIKSEGTVPDSIFIQEKNNRKAAEERAIKLGIIVRDTIKVSVRDSLFKTGGYDTLAYIPYTNQTTKFQLRAGTIKTLSLMTRPVFELKVHNNSFMQGLPKDEEQLVINLNDAARDNNEYAGFIIGSMDEVTTAGNWD